MLQGWGWAFTTRSLVPPANVAAWRSGEQPRALCMRLPQGAPHSPSLLWAPSTSNQAGAGARRVAHLRRPATGWSRCVAHALSESACNRCRRGTGRFAEGLALGTMLWSGRGPWQDLRDQLPSSRRSCGDDCLLAKLTAFPALPPLPQDLVHHAGSLLAPSTRCWMQRDELQAGIALPARSGAHALHPCMQRASVGCWVGG